MMRLSAKRIRNRHILGGSRLTVKKTIYGSIGIVESVQRKNLMFHFFKEAKRPPVGLLEYPQEAGRVALL